MSKFCLPWIFTKTNVIVCSNQVAAVFSDSVFSNGLWSYFVTIDNPTFNISFLQDYLHIKLTQPPQVQFDATGTSIIIIGSLTWANATSSFDGTFKQIIQVSVSVVADKQISAQLAAGQLTVQITNMKNIVIAASTVQQAVTFFFFVFIFRTLLTGYF